MTHAAPLPQEGAHCGPEHPQERDALKDRSHYFQIICPALWMDRLATCKSPRVALFQKERWGKVANIRENEKRQKENESLKSHQPHARQEISSGASKQPLGETKTSNNQYHRRQDLGELNVRVTNQATSCEAWGHEIVRKFL